MIGSLPIGSKHCSKDYSKGGSHVSKVNYPDIHRELFRDIHTKLAPSWLPYGPKGGSRFTEVSYPDIYKQFINTKPNTVK